jgi:predicted transcriptional regulator
MFVSSVIRCGELYREQDNYFKDGFRYVFVPLHYKKTKKQSKLCWFIPTPYLVLYFST